MYCCLTWYLRSTHFLQEDPFQVYACAIMTRNVYNTRSTNCNIALTCDHNNTLSRSATVVSTLKHYTQLAVRWQLEQQSHAKETHHHVCM
eukprot:m.357970 g.357970  ORF g.357970 m.357970 type:complete len:90 (-) comp18000_c0_seq1:38-307(-)